MPADFNYGVTRVACNTSTGTQDITISGFGTPKAAIFTITKATANDTVTSDAAIGIGLTDGTTQYAMSVISQHGVGTTVAKRRFEIDECVLIIDIAGNVDGEANFTAWITDGVQITWGNAPADAYLLTVTFIGGTDLSSEVNIVDPGNTANAVTTVSGMSFAPQGVLFIGHGSQPAATTDNNSVITYGMAAKNSDGVVSNGGTIFSSSAQAAAVCSSRIAPGRIVSNTSGVFNYDILFNELTSDGFIIETPVASGNRDIGTLALAINGGAISTSYFNLAASTTGNRELKYQTTATPVGAMYIGTEQSSNSGVSTTNTFGWMLSSTDGNSEFSNSIADEDAAATSNTQSKSTNRLIDIDDFDGTQMRDGTHVSFGAGTHTINISAADATDRGLIGMMFSDVEETVSGGGDLRTKRMQIIGAD